MHRIFQTLESRVNQEAHAARAPCGELGTHVLRDKRDLRGPANEFVLLRLALRSNKREVGRAVGRRDRYETAARKLLRARVEDELKAQQVHVEVQAAVQIAHIDGDRLEAEIRIPAVQPNRGTVNPLVRRATHGASLYDGAVR